MRIKRRDVVYGADPFKSGDTARPWLVISNDTHPFHDEQSIVQPLTTRSWHDGLIPIPDDPRLEGGTPTPSRIVPWTVETIDHTDVRYRHGRLAAHIVDESVDRFRAFVASHDA